MIKERKGKSGPIIAGCDFVLEERLPHLLSGEERRLVVITDDNVQTLYGDRISAPILAFTPGEASKSRQVKSELEDTLLMQKFGRDTCIIGMGGGVVSDLSGFVAATYCRGVPHIQIPTTLLGMVDAAIGGKTGVNSPFGKNTIGAFHPPREIWIDGAFLSTLPKEEWDTGIVEMMKAGLIKSPALLLSLFDGARRWQERDLSFIMEKIFESASIKADVVDIDPLEKGYRRVLNLGHTIGHAIEKVLGYQIRHGHAIAIGLLVEARIAYSMGLADKQIETTMQELFTLFDVPTSLPAKISEESMREALASDKKGLHSAPRFTLLEGIGSVAPFNGAYCTPVPEKILTDAIAWMNETLGGCHV